MHKKLVLRVTCTTQTTRFHGLGPAAATVLPLSLKGAGAGHGDGTPTFPRTRGSTRVDVEFNTNPRAKIKNGLFGPGDKSPKNTFRRGLMVNIDATKGECF